ncbi:MAG TPA: DUF4232 domain-containing protein [Pseudonocardia sp.]|nr:DUF4232 domain-containing protein [Pseudonocardia sp.]
MRASHSFPGVLVGLALLAGCAAVPAASAAPVPSPAPVPAAATATAGEPPCVPAQLSGRVEQDGEATGHRFATLVVTNSSNHTCTLYGYGGAALYTASGVPIPTRMVRVGGPWPTLVTLLPGAGAGMDLHWSLVPTGDDPVEGPCQVPASEIRVIPPDGTSPFWVIWDLGPVCDGGRIEQSAYYPLTERGTAG